VQGQSRIQSVPVSAQRLGDFSGGHPDLRSRYHTPRSIGSHRSPTHSRSVPRQCYSTYPTGSSRPPHARRTHSRC
jgi:hypothetical protein